MRTALIFVIAMVTASFAVAGPPAVGSYYSDDFGGVMLMGRFSESWLPAGAYGQIGNTTNAMSWDGSVLGSEWKMWCMSIAAAPSLVADTRDINATDNVSTFTVTTTYHYVTNNPLGIRSNVVMSGYSDGYDNCMDYSINNAAFLSDTDVESFPSNLPPFLDSSCATGILDRGGWGTATEIALTITGGCTVPTDESSWGAVKALYQN